MIMRVPISFDNTVLIQYSDGSTERSTVFPARKGLISCTFNKMNGYDANNNRVTNLVGFDGTELIKKCPGCYRDKRVTSFGYAGRTTNEKRDQSQCSECRAQY